jgi:hypothetical protein
MRAALLISAALIASPAFAQSNDQYQGGDAASTTVIDVGQTQDAAATAVASGNVVGVAADDANAFILNDQHMDGDTTAVTDANVDNADGNVVASSAAVANGATAELRGSTVTIDALTLAHGDTMAETNFTGGHAANAATSASAAGNVAAVSTEYSDAELLIAQESTGDTTAIINAEHDEVDGQVVSGAIASANNLSVTGYTTTLLSRTRQTAEGDVAADVNLNAEHATDASGNATASANSIALANQWGHLETRVIQNASSNVSANSEVTLSESYDGFGSAGAYGVGNQMLVSNVGSDTLMNVVQDNAGDISANAAFAGEGGDSALASSAAYGNNVEGTLCSQCDTNVPSLQADNTQSNSGDVSASASVNSPFTTMAAASSTAIGNAATFSARGPGTP